MTDGPSQPEPPGRRPDGDPDPTPPRGFQPPSPWSAPGAGHSGMGQQPMAPVAQPPAGPPGGPPQPPAPGGSPRPRRGGLVAGALLLVLVVGGLAGALGGYLAGSRDETTASGPNALNQPPPATTSGRPAPAGSVEDVARKVLPAVVELQYTTGQGQATGSGVVFSPDGLILTNNHVVAEDNGAPIRARWQNGSTAQVSIVGQDPTSDLAVVRAQDVRNLPTARFGRSGDLRIGEPVVAFGAPFRLAGTVTSGIVSALHRPTRAGGQQGGQDTVLDAVQTDAAINPGNSGGPLVDSSGAVIGINSAIYSPPSSGLGGGQQAGNVGIGFAIPIDQARRIGDQLARTGRATQALLGVTVRDAPQPGAQVINVTPGGPAQKAGLRPGDRVTTFNGRPLESADALVAAVHAAAPGSRVTLGVGGRDVVATLGGKPVR